MINLQTRFYLAMGMYAILAILAGTTLDGKLRIAVWIFLGGLALRTLLSMKARE